MASNPMQQFTVHRIGPEIKIEGSSKSIFSLLKSESNLICSSDFSPKQKINTILLANSYSKNQYDAKITDSVYELLNLDKCYYLVSPSGLVTMVDLNSNLNQLFIIFSPY